MIYYGKKRGDGMQSIHSQKFSSFRELLETLADTEPERTALRYAGGSRSRRALLEEAEARARVLKAQGKSCLGVLCDGSYACVLEIFAAVLAGLQLVLLDGNLPEEELPGLLKKTDVDALWGGECLEEDMTPHLTRGVRDGAGKILFFTSGTTASARAVALTEASLCCSAYNGGSLLPLDPSDRLLLMLPLNHVFGFVCGLLWPLSFVIKYANGAKAGVKVYDRDTTNPTNFTGDVPLSLFIEGDGYNYLGTTVKIDDRQLYTVELTSTDRAGRVGIATSEVYVDESTDKPIVTLSNTNVDINSAADVSSESGHNLFNQTSNSKMLGTITDDDGIASIVVEYAAVTNGTAASYETEPLFSVSNVGTTYNFAADLKKNGASLSEGKYKIRITVLDTTEAAANHKTVEEFFLAIDNGAPSITVSTGSGYMKDNFTVEGKVSDAALKTIYRYAVTQGILASTPSAKWEAGSASNTIDYNSTTNVWKDNYSEISKAGSVAYIAEDEYGQSTEVSWSY
ncbi:MAG: AMP-binding protein, partial [Bacteroidales bacterium]|nr:AMP-binding protein [Bacteroidales bacterium]